MMLVIGIANLIEKYKNDQMNALDVLQFSMSVFFFTNTLIQPKTATSIIQNAQETHIQNYANGMTDGETKVNFNKFLDDNKGDGSIKHNSKIVRTINRMPDANEFFGSIKDGSTVKLGGRKGKTVVLVSNDGKNETRISTSSKNSKILPSTAVNNPFIVSTAVIKKEEVDDSLLPNQMTQKPNVEIIPVVEPFQTDDIIQPTITLVNDQGGEGLSTYAQNIREVIETLNSPKTDKAIEVIGGVLSGLTLAYKNLNENQNDDSPQQNDSSIDAGNGNGTTNAEFSSNTIDDESESLETRRHIRPINPDNALLENPTVLFPNRFNDQIIAIRHHFFNRILHQWMHLRVLEPYIEMLFGTRIQIFVLDGPIYQDRHNQQGTEFAAHVNIFRVNTELEQSHPKLYWILVDFISQTENIPKELYHCAAVGGQINEMGKDIIRNHDMSLIFYLKRTEVILRQSRNSARDAVARMAFESLILTLNDDFENELQRLFDKVIGILSRNFSDRFC